MTPMRHFPFTKEEQFQLIQSEGENSWCKVLQLKMKMDTTFREHICAQFDSYLLNVITNYQNDDQLEYIKEFLGTVQWME